MTGPPQSGRNEWTSADLAESDIAVILATLPALPESLKTVAVERLGIILFAWRDDLDTADDPTAGTAAAWFDDLEQNAAALRKRMAAAPAALRERLYDAAYLRANADASEGLRQIETALGRLEIFAADAAAMARPEQSRGRGGARRERGPRYRLSDAILDLYAFLQRRAPVVIAKPSWSLSGALPRFFGACMAIASRNDEALKDYVPGKGNALAAFEAGKVAFDDWRKRRRKFNRSQSL